MAAVLLLAFVVRVWDLAGQSFWWDEAYSTLLAEAGLGAIFRDLVAFDFHPPLSYLLTLGWLSLAGRSEFALRYLAVACGCLTVAVGARLGHRLYGPAGEVAAGLTFALSPFLVYYSREARMYAPTALLATLALYLLHRALETDRWRRWLAYAVVCALGLYTFYYFAFVPVFGGVWVVATRLPRATSARGRSAAGSERAKPPTLGRWLGATLATALLYLPWLPVLLARNAVWESLWATPSSPAKTLAWSWVGLTLGLPDLTLYARPAVAALLLALALALAAGLALRRRAPQPYLFALLGCAVPLGLMAAVAMVKPVFHPRYAVAAAPALLLAFAGLLSGPRPPAPFPPHGDLRPTVAGGGGAGLPPSRAAKGDGGPALLRLLSALLLLGAAAFGLVSLAADPAYARDDYRSAVAEIDAGLQPGDVVIENADPGFRYYYRGAAPASQFPGAPYDEEHVVAGLNALTRGKQRLWYLRHFQVPTDPEGFVEAQLLAHAALASERWYGSLRVTRYDLPPEPQFAAAVFTPTRANFGGRLLLTGYSLARPEVPSGGAVDLTLRWSVLAPGDDYGVRAGLADEFGRSWGRDDRQPRDRRLQLSSRWQPGEVVTTRHRLPALVGTPPGAYRLEIGVYRLADLRGLDVLDDLGRPRGQSFSPGTVGVVRPAAFPASDPALPAQVHAPATPEVELAAYQVVDARTGPGGRVRLTLLWRALAVPGQDYSVALRLLSPGGAELARSAGPAADGRLPPRQWQPGELVRDQRQLDIPAAAPPGKATLQAGLALPGAAAPETWLTLGEVELDAVARRFAEPAIPNRVDLDLGGRFRLLGYRLDSGAVAPGGTLRLTLYWRALAEGDRSYRVFTHLLDAESVIRGQKDAEPVDWTYPTSGWLAGEVVEDPYVIEVQRDAPPGRLELEVGMYDPESGERLGVTAPDGEARGDRIVLQSVAVR